MTVKGKPMVYIIARLIIFSPKFMSAFLSWNQLKGILMPSGDPLQKPKWITEIKGLSTRTSS